MTDSTNQPKIQLQRLYVKELTCKVPHAPNFFISPDLNKDNNGLKFNIEIHPKVQPLPEQQYEVTLHATILAKIQESTTAFSIDAQQAGIFKIEGFQEEQLNKVLKENCPMLLYPYLAKVITEASLQAGFPPVLLSPLGFNNSASNAQQQNSNEQIVSASPNKSANHKLESTAEIM